MPTVPGDPEFWLSQFRQRGLEPQEAAARPPAGSPKKKRGKPEAEFQEQVIGLARANGWRVAHFRAVRVQRKNGQVYHETPVAADGAGFPDLILVRRGRLIVAELKVGANTTTAEQDAWLAAFKAAGAETYVWYPLDWKHHITRKLA